MAQVVRYNPDDQDHVDQTLVSKRTLSQCVSFGINRMVVRELPRESLRDHRSRGSIGLSFLNPVASRRKVDIVMVVGARAIRAGNRDKVRQTREVLLGGANVVDAVVVRTIHKRHAGP
jgi:hypothetical protein